MSNRDLKICALIPTYNNAATIVDVLVRTHNFLADIIVVVDGSTDDTLQRISTLDFPLTIVSYPRNRGKGYALRQGLTRARQMGFRYALTLDSDGQHFPENIPSMIKQVQRHPNSLVVGSRRLVQDNMPRRNTFANRFSNFWFMVQTGLRLPDTQTGMRIYPLHRLTHLRWLTDRYEAELELLVFLTWAEVRVIPVPIDVYYPPKEQRVSHFRPLYDFTRISILNTLLCIIALVYGLPRRYWRGVLFVLKLFLLCVALMPLAALTILLNRVRWVRLAFNHLATLCIRLLVHHINGAKMSIKSPELASPVPNLMVISQHASILDALIILSLRPKTVMLTKGYVPHNPLYGLITQAMELCTISEGYDNIEQILRNKVSQGYSIAVFPEGSRSLTGEISRFHKGAFLIAEQLHLPIQPIELYGTYHVLNKLEFRLYHNPFFVEYFPLVAADDLSFGNNYKERTKTFESYFKTLKAKYDDIYLNHIV